VPLTIRACRPEECPHVLALWKSAEAIPRPTDTLPDLQRIVREHPDTLLVGEEDGRLVGSVIAGWDGWRGGIYRLAVRPECRRRGVGQALVAEAERRLVARGARRLSAMVARDEAHAMAFWDAAPGWARDARWQRYTKDLGG
jgi:ribosomal protein S18 acetylase RimI-like enzyme